MKLTIGTDQAFKLAQVFGRQILMLDHRGKQEHDNHPQAHVVINEDDDGKCVHIGLEIRYDSNTHPLPPNLILNDYGIGNNFSEAFACLMYTCRQELEERIKAHQELLAELIVACPVKGDPGYQEDKHEPKDS